MFKGYKEKLVLDEDKIEVPSLKKLVGKLKKDEALQLCLFLFLVYDRSDENPMKDLSESERRKDAGSTIFGDEEVNLIEIFPGNDTLIRTSIEEYVAIGKNDKMQKELDLYDKKIYQFIAQLEDPKNAPKIVRNEHDLSGKVSFTTNIDILTQILDDVIKIIYDKATVLGMKKSGKFLKGLRGGLSPNMKGKTKQIEG